MEQKKEKDIVFSSLKERSQPPAQTLKSLVDLVKGYSALVTRLYNLSHASTDNARWFANWSGDAVQMIQKEEMNIKPERQEADIVPLLTALCDKPPVLAKDRSITLEKIFAPNLPLVKIDRIRMRQTLMLILEAVLHFCQKSTTVTVKVEMQNQEVTIFFAYKGMSFEETETKIAFDRTTRFNTLSNQKEIPSGLNLWMIRQVIEAHKGEIQLVSQKEVGATFVVTLPPVLSD
jgi:signal transduction histidine kinase